MAKAKKNLAKDVETKSAKLKLSTLDRVVLGKLFPKQNDILGQMVARDIADKVQINQSEAERIEFRPRETGGVQWNDKAKDKVIEFTSAEIEFLRTQVTRLDKAKQITSDLLELCLKIKE